MSISSKSLKTAIDEYLEIQDIFFLKIMLTREDGLIIYTNNFDRNDSVGVLVSGLWQAAETLADILTRDKEEFKLSFDSSSTGLLIFPVYLKDQKIYLSFYYENEVNPSKYKIKLRSLKNFLIEEQKRFSIENNAGDFLFRDITDEEVEKLFSFSGI